MEKHPAQGQTLDPFGLRNGDPQISKLRFYSIGIVAANKRLKSKEIEVHPTEELPMMDGELDDQRETHQAAGEDSSGQSYQSNVKMANSIKATWLPFGSSQRITAPDVRRGESVMIYQFGDADKYYWVTLKQDNHLRRLETVIWAFSATKQEISQLSAENSYFLEVSTHTKTVTFHTSQADGEPFGYDIQINAKEGRIEIRDTAGNLILMDSRNTQLRMENSVGAFLDITKQIATLTTADKITLNTQSMVLNNTTTTVNASSVVRFNTPFIDAP